TPGGGGLAQQLPELPTLGMIGHTLPAASFRGVVVGQGELGEGAQSLLPACLKQAAPCGKEQAASRVVWHGCRLRIGEERPGQLNLTAVRVGDNSALTAVPAVTAEGRRRAELGGSPLRDDSGQAWR